MGTKLKFSTLDPYSVRTVLFLKVVVLMSTQSAWAAWYIVLRSPLQLERLPVLLLLAYSELNEPYWAKLANLSMPAHTHVQNVRAPWADRPIHTHVQNVMAPWADRPADTHVYNVWAARADRQAHAGAHSSSQSNKAA